MSSYNPFEPGQAVNPPQRSDDPSELTTADKLVAIFCSGIGCIVGIVRLIQGKPNAGKMIGLSIACAILWNILRLFIQVALQNK